MSLTSYQTAPPRIMNTRDVRLVNGDKILVCGLCATFFSIFFPVTRMSVPFRMYMR
jgi:hypothetical protein